MKNEAVWNDKTKSLAKPSINEAQTFASEYLPEIDGLVIDDDEGMQLANEVLREIKGRHKKIEETRKRIVDPLNAAKKEVQNLFGPPLKLLKSLEDRVKDKIAKAVEGAYDRQRVALTQAAQASMEGDTEAAAEAMMEAAQAELAPVDGLSLRHTWDFEVTDVNLIPPEYMVIDSAAIKSAIRATEGEVEIPGIKVVRKTSVASRAG